MGVLAKGWCEPHPHRTVQTSPNQGTAQLTLVSESVAFVMRMARMIQIIQGLLFVAKLLRLTNQETQMIKPVIKFVVLGVFLTALSLSASTQVFAQAGMGGGMGGGGTGAGAGGAGGAGAGAGAGGAGSGGGGFGGGYFYSAGPGGAGAIAGPGSGWGFYSNQQPGSSYASTHAKAARKHRKAM
jgi:hypothetical protein